APVGFIQMLRPFGFGLAAACLDSFSEKTPPEDPFHEVYDNFFSLPERLRKNIAEFQAAGRELSLDALFSPEISTRPDDPQVIENLKRRFLAVAFMTSAEVVEAGLISFADFDRLCQQAFLWERGPFLLMNLDGPALALQLVTERMELSHRQAVNFPVPRLLVEQARKNEPWAL
ncbi:MAG: hypothetical protein AB1715_12965, partial [Acidobacteriota bacterium]